MKAPTYIERSAALKMIRDNEMAMHQKKMSQIATSNKAVKEAKEITKMMKKSKDERMKTKQFLTNEKNLGINKDN